MSRECPNCGMPIPKSAKICPHCHVDLLEAEWKQRSEKWSTFGNLMLYFICWIPIGLILTLLGLLESTWMVIISLILAFILFKFVKGLFD